MAVAPIEMATYLNPDSIVVPAYYAWLWLLFDVYIAECGRAGTQEN